MRHRDFSFWVLLCLWVFYAGSRLGFAIVDSHELWLRKVGEDVHDLGSLCFSN